MFKKELGRGERFEVIERDLKVGKCLATSTVTPVLAKFFELVYDL